MIMALFFTEDKRNMRRRTNLESTDRHIILNFWHCLLLPAPVVVLSAFVPLTFVDSLLLRCHFAYILRPLNDGQLA